MYINRSLEKGLSSSIKQNPVTAIIGPRQCGKSTLAKHMLDSLENTLYLDLERPSDLRKLDDAEWFLQSQSDKCICLDEIQRKPNLFPVIRSLCDEYNRAGMYIILGSASRDLLKQSSESLAGRISYKKLSPFLWNEISHYHTLEDYLLKGGFPRSLQNNNNTSYEWRQDFITTFLERDLLQFSGFAPQTMRRLWQMLAHNNGQTANFSALSSSLGVSHTTIRNYIDLLEGTFMLYQLKPYHLNTKKRMVKSPKVYLSDTGIINALLQLRDYDQIAGHPVFGSLWETLVLTNLLYEFPEHDFSFFRSSHGAEIDIIACHGNKTIAIECKASTAPKLTKGNHSALKDIDPDKTFIAAPVQESYSMRDNMEVVGIEELMEGIENLVG